MTDSEILQRYGLSKVGHWEFGEFASAKHLSHLRGISFVLDATMHSIKDIVYAFLVDGHVCYIGETTNGLKDRFLSYRYGNTTLTDTDNAVKQRITVALEQ